MSDKQVSQRQIDAFRRFLKLLPRGEDLTLVILKGHLLIEEQVRQIIAERMKRPNALIDARLECYQAICIAEALCPEEEEYVWNAVKKLNNIRNELAHKTEPVGIDDRIEDFVNSVPWVPDVEDRVMQIKYRLFALFEAVSSLAERPTATIHELVKRNDEET